MLINEYAYTFGIKHSVLTIYISLMSFSIAIWYDGTIWPYDVINTFIWKKKCDTRVWYLLPILLCCVFGEKRFLQLHYSYSCIIFCFHDLLSPILVKLCNCNNTLSRNILGWNLPSNKAHCIKIHLCESCQVGLHHTPEKWYSY
jgi:hypothetical protein